MTSSVTTFYSYKGGSGRSMTMANVAWALATNGEKVLTIDWDLEAPGLHRYFHPFLRDPSQSQSPGLMDHVWRYIRQLTEGDEQDGAPGMSPADLVQELQLPFDGPGLLHFIGAGTQDDHYSDKVGGLDWATFYSRFGGEAFLKEFMDWARSSYTHILIDSRTGVADSAGICTTQLPDTVVMCTVYNRQSIEGTAAVARSIVNGRRGRSIPPAQLIIVPSRVEDRSNVNAARLHCSALLKDALRSSVASTMALRTSEIKHYPWCSFEEKLAIFEEVPGDSGSLLEATHRLASRIAERVLEPKEMDPAHLAFLWRRAAFEDPRLVELEALSSAPDSEAVSKLLQWLDDAVHEPDSRHDWTGPLGLACVRQASVFSDVDERAADFLSEEGFRFARQAYEHDARGYRPRFLAALHARSDFLQRKGRLAEAFDLAKHATKLAGSSPSRRAQAYERLAELTLLTSGPSAALPLYQAAASNFEHPTLRSMETATASDALRLRRLLAEQHVKLGNVREALDVARRSLDDLQHTDRLHRSSVAEAAALLGLYAEIAALVMPEQVEHVLQEVRATAGILNASPTSLRGLERKLALVESGAHARRNQIPEALADIDHLMPDHAEVRVSEPLLDETWNSQIKLRLSVRDHDAVRKLLAERTKHGTRVLSRRLAELIEEYMRQTGDPQPLYDLLLSSVGSGALDPKDEDLLGQMLSRSGEWLANDKEPVLRFLLEHIKRSAPAPTPAEQGR